MTRRNETDWIEFLKSGFNDAPNAKNFDWGCQVRFDFASLFLSRQWGKEFTNTFYQSHSFQRSTGFYKYKHLLFNVFHLAFFSPVKNREDMHYASVKIETLCLECSAGPLVQGRKLMHVPFVNLSCFSTTISGLSALQGKAAFLKRSTEYACIAYHSFSCEDKGRVPLFLTC